MGRHEQQCRSAGNRVAAMCVALPRRSRISPAVSLQYLQDSHGALTRGEQNRLDLDWGASRNRLEPPHKARQAGGTPAAQCDTRSGWARAVPARRRLRPSEESRDGKLANDNNLRGNSRGDSFSLCSLLRRARAGASGKCQCTAPMHRTADALNRGTRWCLTGKHIHSLNSLPALDVRMVGRM
jgi:hypothetical protein